jgi:hypothetical protein
LAQLARQELVVFNQRDSLRAQDYRKRTRLLADKISNLNLILFENEEGSYEKFIGEAETLTRAIRQNTWGSLIKSLEASDTTTSSRIGLFIVAAFVLILIIMQFVSSGMKDVLGGFLVLVLLPMLAIRLVNASDLNRYWPTFQNFLGMFNRVRGIASRVDGKDGVGKVN